MAAAGQKRAPTADRIESLLSARLFLEPQLAGDALIFISNISGQLSLYSMAVAGGVPEPLLPPRIALQNPELIGGYSFYLAPDLDRIVVLIDKDGDENYEPFVLPLSGGFPEPLAPDAFAGRRSHLLDFDPKTNVAYFASESRQESLISAIRVDLESGAVETLWESPYGAMASAWSPDHSRVIFADTYTLGDSILYEPDGAGGRRILYGTALEDRVEGTEYRPSGIRSAHHPPSGRGLLLASASSTTRELPATSTSSGRARSSRSRSRARGTRGSGSSRGSSTSTRTATRSSTTSTAARGPTRRASTRRGGV